MIHRFAPLLPHFAFLLALSPPLLAAGGKSPPIIPLPEKMELKDGFFPLARGKPGPGTAPKILVDSASEETGRYLAAQLGMTLGVKIPVLRDSSGAAKGRVIRLTTNG